MSFWLIFALQNKEKRVSPPSSTPTEFRNVRRVGRLKIHLLNCIHDLFNRQARYIELVQDCVGLITEYDQDGKLGFAKLETGMAELNMPSASPSYNLICDYGAFTKEREFILEFQTFTLEHMKQAKAYEEFWNAVKKIKRLICKPGFNRPLFGPAFQKKILDMEWKMKAEVRSHVSNFKYQVLYQLQLTNFSLCDTF